MEPKNRSISKTEEVIEFLYFCEVHYSIKLKMFTPYQYRLDGTLDIYPVNSKYHDVNKNERGTYSCIETLINERILKPKGL